MQISNSHSSPLSRCAPGLVLISFAVLARPVLAQDDSPAATSTMSLFFACLAVVAVVCLIIGWENPKRFKFALGDKATTPFVRGGFGAAILVFGFLGQSLDPGRSADQIASNERRVARSEARLQDAQRREQDAKGRERKAQQSEREARKKERDAASQQRQAQKEAQRAQSQAEKIQAQNVRAEKARKQRESDRSNEGQENRNTGEKSSTNWTKKLSGLLDNVGKFQDIQPYVARSSTALIVRNRDDFTWKEVRVSINPTSSWYGGYEYRVKEIPSAGEVIIPFEELATTRGERLNLQQTKLIKDAILCKTSDGVGGAMGKW